MVMNNQYEIGGILDTFRTFIRHKRKNVRKIPKPEKPDINPSKTRKYKENNNA